MTDTFSFILRLTMLSDWHVGTGSGRHGAIDRLIERDQDGLPFVPATTLRGIWRDAAERVALGLDEGITDSDWSKVVDAIFGDQPALRARREAEDGEGLADDQPHAEVSDDGDSGRPPCAGVLSLSAARFRDKFACCLRDPTPGGKDAGRERLRKALSFVKPGVAMDTRTGAARHDMLRFEEVARQGAVLEAHGEIRLDGRWPDKARESAFALLLAATKLVERLGGKRRRGNGRCEAELTIASGTPFAIIPDAVTWLQDNKKPTLPTTASGFTAGEDTAFFGYRSIGNADDGWERQPLDLLLLSPLVIADDVLGNVVTSLDFIPGTYLLPHVTQALRGNGFDPRPYIAAGDIRISNATIHLDDTRALPVPMAWARGKDDEDETASESSEHVDGNAGVKPLLGPDGKGTVWNDFNADDRQSVERRIEKGKSPPKPLSVGYVVDRDKPRPAEDGHEPPEFLRRCVKKKCAPTTRFRTRCSARPRPSAVSTAMRRCSRDRFCVPRCASASALSKACQRDGESV